MMKATSETAQAPNVWAPPAATVAAGALGVVGGDLTPYAPTVQVVGAGLIAGGAVVALAAWRQHERQQLLDNAARGLGRLIGSGAQVEVRAYRWQGPGMVGTPRKLRVSYDPGVAANPEWLMKVKDQVVERFDQEFRLLKHDARRRRLVYVQEAMSEDLPVPEVADRAQGMVEHLLGSGAKHSFTWDGQDLVAVDVAHKAGVRVSPSSAIRNNIERTWQAMLPGRWRARWDLEQDTVRFEIRPKIPAVLERDFGPVPADRMDAVEYAVDEDGNTLYWDLSPSAAQPHCLITGSTGAGKTNTMRGIITSLSRRSGGERPPPRMLLCDPKRIEFAGFRGWPNVEIVATSVPDIVATIRYVFLEMERRYALIESGEAGTDEFPRLVLVVDEFRYFYGVCNTWYASVKPSGGTKECPIFSDFFAIASLGRSAGVHLLLGTQRPDAYWLGGDVRDQFAARYSLGRLSPDAAKMMWGAHHIGVSVPRGVPGRGTSVLPDGTPVECQSYWTPDPRSSKPADQELLDRIRPTSSYWAPHVVVPPAEIDEDGQPLEPKGRYSEFADAQYALAQDHPDVVAAHKSARAMLAAPTAAPTQDQEQEAGVYGEPIIVRAGDVHDHEGWLLLVDEASDTWGVIDTVEDDVLDGEHLILGWRSDEGDSEEGLLTVDSSGHLTVREPVETPSQ